MSTTHQPSSIPESSRKREGVSNRWWQRDARRGGRSRNSERGHDAMSRTQSVVGAMGSGVLLEVVAGDVRCDGFGRPVIETTRQPANSCVGSNCWNQRLTEYNAVDTVSRLTQATIATGSATSQSQGYTYDAWGNMVTYGGQPRAVSGTTNRLSNASYDARSTSRGQGGGRDAGARAEAAFRGGWDGG